MPLNQNFNLRIFTNLTIQNVPQTQAAGQNALEVNERKKKKFLVSVTPNSYKLISIESSKQY